MAPKQSFATEGGAPTHIAVVTQALKALLASALNSHSRAICDATPSPIAFSENNERLEFLISPGKLRQRCTKNGRRAICGGYGFVRDSKMFHVARPLTFYFPRKNSLIILLCHPGSGDQFANVVCLMFVG